MCHAEVWVPVVVPLSETTGLADVHYCWGKAFIAETLQALVPGKHLIVMDHDAMPTSLFEISDLVALGQSLTRTACYPAVIGMADAACPVNAGCIIFPSRNISEPQRTRDEAREAVANARHLIFEQSKTYHERDLSSVVIPSTAAWQCLHDDRILENTPLAGARLYGTEQVLTAWTLLGDFMNALGFERDAAGKYTRSGSTARLPPDIARIFPPVTTWSDVMFEQGSLSIILRMVSAQTPCIMLPAELSFMQRKVYAPLPGTALGSDAITVCLPIFLHALGKGTDDTLQR